MPQDAQEFALHIIQILDKESLVVNGAGMQYQWLGHRWGVMEHEKSDENHEQHACTCDLLFIDT